MPARPMRFPNLLLIGTLSVVGWAAPECGRAQRPASRATDFAVTSPPDGITVAAEGPSVDVPWLLSPLVRGDGGVQALRTVHDEPHFLFRLGAGYAVVRATGVAPPLQPAPARRWNIEGSALALRHDGGEFYASMERRNWAQAGLAA